MNVSWSNNDLNIVGVEFDLIEDVIDVLGSEVDVSVGFPVSTDDVLSFLAAPCSLSTLWKGHESETSVKSSLWSHFSAEV
jgi:hypothetical protein